MNFIARKLGKRPSKTQMDRMMKACADDDDRAVAELLVSGFDVYTPLGKRGNNVLAYATEVTSGTNVCKFLVRKFGSKLIAHKNKIAGSNCFREAARFGRLEAVKVFLEAGFTDLESPCTDGLQTALWAAAGLGHFEIVKLLADKGAKLDIAETEGGQTPLWIAASKGFIDVVEFLATRCDNVDQPELDGQTPLYISCCRGQYAVAQILLAHGADVNHIESSTRYTSIYAGVHNQKLDIVRLLLSYGARRSKARVSPLEYARVHLGQQAQITNWLFQTGEFTMFHHAIASRLPERVFEIMSTSTNNLFSELVVRVVTLDGFKVLNLLELCDGEAMAGIPPSCSRTTTLVRHFLNPWTPKTTMLFGPTFPSFVKVVLLLRMRLELCSMSGPHERQTLPSLPWEMWEHIISFCARSR
eukprot:m.109408 g.109408  ORF g.109408 m.109408 type:complete len:415 (-) comp22681_c0_seq3:195-1439(-)